MSAASDYLENQLLNHVLNNVPFASPAGVWIGLSTTTTTDAGAFTEPVGNGYARVSVVGNFTLAGGGAGSASNTVETTFPLPTGAGWGTITHFFLIDASSGGNVLYHAAVSPAQAVPGNVTVKFIAGALVVTCA